MSKSKAIAICQEETGQNYQTGKKIDGGGMNKTVKRFDISPIDFMHEDINGFLRGDGAVTRIGVFTYVNPDGSLRKELRHPDDILRIDSLNTMRMIPITNGHPADLVSPQNAKQLSVGNVGENIRPDGAHILAPVAVTDAGAIGDINRGKKALSLGYRVDLIEEAGEYDGIRYDYRQTNVRYNHLAIVDRARAGNGAQLKFDGFNLDAEDAITVFDKGESDEIDWDSFVDDEYVADVDACAKHKDRTAALKKALKALGKRKSANKARIKAGKKPILGGKEVSLQTFIKKTSLTKGKVKKIKKGDALDTITTNPKKEKRRMDNDVFKIDGISYDAAPEVVNFIGKLQTKHDTLEKELNTKLDEIDTMKKDLDKVTGERDDALDKLKKAENNTDAINAAVKTRVDIMQVAEKVISSGLIKIDDKDVKLDDASNTDLMKGVILSQYPDVNFDEKSDEYIQARYDAVVETISKDGIKRQKKVVTNVDGNKDDDHVDADDARDQMVKDMKAAHQPKES